MSDWIIDKSAYVRLGTAPDSSEWTVRIHRGQVCIATVTRLELGFSARDGDDLRRETYSQPLVSMPITYLTPRIEDRAMEVQVLLSDRGHHRAPSVPDLIVAATGEILRLTVLHLDKDFDLIAEITGQSIERIRT